MRAIYGFVYLVRNRVSGKVYIGQTTGSIATRWNKHKIHARKNKTVFARALMSYGPDAFVVVELGRAFSVDELNEMERRAIFTHDATNREYGYNTEPGGGCGPVSIETRMKLSASRTGKKLSAEHRANIGRANKGRKISSEVFAWRIGKKLSAETRAKISRALTGIKRIGRPLTEEQRAKLIASHKGKKLSEETRAKMRR